jgi:hypothetical protein
MLLKATNLLSFKIGKFLSSNIVYLGASRSIATIEVVLAALISWSVILSLSIKLTNSLESRQPSANYFSISFGFIFLSDLLIEL